MSSKKLNRPISTLCTETLSNITEDSLNSLCEGSDTFAIHSGTNTTLFSFPDSNNTSSSVYSSAQENISESSSTQTLKIESSSSPVSKPMMPCQSLFYVPAVLCNHCCLHEPLNAAVNKYSNTYSAVPQSSGGYANMFIRCQPMSLQEYRDVYQCSRVDDNLTENIPPGKCLGARCCLAESLQRDKICNDNLTHPETSFDAARDHVNFNRYHDNDVNVRQHEPSQSNVRTDVLNNDVHSFATQTDEECPTMRKLEGSEASAVEKCNSAHNDLCSMTCKLIKFQLLSETSTYSDIALVSTHHKDNIRNLSKLQDKLEEKHTASCPSISVACLKEPNILGKTLLTSTFNGKASSDSRLISCNKRACNVENSEGIDMKEKDSSCNEVKFNDDEIKNLCPFGGFNTGESSVKCRTENVNFADSCRMKLTEAEANHTGSFCKESEASYNSPRRSVNAADHRNFAADAVSDHCKRASCICADRHDFHKVVPCSVSSSISRLDDQIHLNVGGQKFTTSRATLMLEEPESMLAKMFGGEHPNLSPASLDMYGHYIIDRSPQYFAPLLHYLRTGSLVLDKNINPLGVLQEARYYGLEGVIPKLEKLVAEESGVIEDKPLTRQQVVNALLTTGPGVVLRFQAVNLRGADLSWLDLSGINFKYADLRETNLTGANLSGCNLERAKLSGACLDHAQLLNVRLVCADLHDSSLRATNFENPSGGLLPNCEGVNLRNSVLEGSSMAHVNLRVATLKNANLRNCDLRMSVLAGADLENCDLSGSNLLNANLRGANLKNASFELMQTPLHMSQTCDL